MATLDLGYDYDGNAKTYTDAATCRAAASSYDTIRWWFSDTNQNTYWNETVGEQNTGKPLNHTNGLLSDGINIKCQVLSCQEVITEDITITGFHCINSNSIMYPYLKNGSTANLFFDRCRWNRTVQPYKQTSGDSCLTYFRSCYIDGIDGNGMYSWNGSNADYSNGVAINCTIIGCDSYSYRYMHPYNCLAIGFRYRSFRDSQGGDYNAATDGYAVSEFVHGYQIDLNSVSWLDDAPGYFRLAADDTVLLGAGDSTVANAPTVDFWGRAYDVGNWPIGCDAGLVCATDADIILDSASGGITGGNWTKADKTKVLEGNNFGEGGTSEVATYSCNPPDQPTIAVTNNNDGTATATITDSTAGATNTVYYFADTATVTPTQGTTITGDGSRTFDIDVTGQYWFYALSASGGLTTISQNIVRVKITQSSGTDLTMEEQYIYCEGEEMIIQNMSLTRDENYATTPVYTDSHTAYGWMQAVGSAIANDYGRRELTVTHKVWFAEDPAATEGDRIVDASGNKYVIRGVLNQAGMGDLWRVDVEQQYGN